MYSLPSCTLVPYENPSGSPSSYYCRSCEQYTNAFWPSQVKRHSRTCNHCRAKRLKPKDIPLRVILRKRLLDNLHHQGVKHAAKAVPPIVFKTILEHHNSTDDNIESVRNLSPVFTNGRLVSIMVKYKKRPSTQERQCRGTGVKRSTHAHI